MKPLETAIIRLVTNEPGITSLKVYSEIRKSHTPPQWAIKTLPHSWLGWFYPPLHRVHATIEKLEENSLIRSEPVDIRIATLTNRFTLRRLYPVH